MEEDSQDEVTVYDFWRQREWRRSTGVNSRYRGQGVNFRSLLKPMSMSALKIQLPIQSRAPEPFPLQWNDDLRPKLSNNPIFSNKIFVGGLSEHITERDLIAAFSEFGRIYIDWPTVDDFRRKKLGYCYVVFEYPTMVYYLLNSPSLTDRDSQEWHMDVPATATCPSRRRNPPWHQRNVQIIPWDTKNNYFASVHFPTVYERFHLVFVGGLHGRTTAKDLYEVIDALFHDQVCFVALDVDKCNYPLGAARVALRTRQAYVDAIKLHYVLVKARRSERQLQIEPFILPNRVCYKCRMQQAPFMCRHESCLQYVCIECFREDHMTSKVLKELRDHQMIFKGPSRVQKNVSDATLSCIHLDYIHRLDYLQPYSHNGISFSHFTD